MIMANVDDDEGWHSKYGHRIDGGNNTDDDGSGSGDDYSKRLMMIQ